MDKPKRWNGKQLWDMRDFFEDNIYWQRADEMDAFVADLARRVLPDLRNLYYRIMSEEGEDFLQQEIPPLEKHIAELEQITEGGGDVKETR